MSGVYALTGKLYTGKQDLNAMSRGGDGAMDCGIDESNKQVSKTGDRQ